jgi:two-component system chemotaxis response regulator CheY
MLHAAAESASGRRDRTVLVVDDDAIQRAAVAELLSSRGYEVVVACDGQEAVELLQDGLRPSVIVLDLTMPRMDGWTFLAHLRRIAHSAVPVLVTSAAASERPPAGADACLEKPIKAAQLREMVAWLSGRSRHAPWTT